MRRTDIFTPQWIHDYVVRSIAASARGYLVHTNAHNGHDSCVSSGIQEFAEIFPDVLLCDPESFGVRHVVEVEMDASITPQQVLRWVEIYHGARKLMTADFWILVPPDRMADALRLCREHGIPAHIGSWKLRPEGVTLTWGDSRAAETSAGPAPQESIRVAWNAHLRQEKP